MKKIFATLICLILSYNVYAVPRQIILLRHADKLNQKITGPALSPTGYVRAVKFSFYLLSRFGEPDFVIAGKPKGKNASIRELQTVGPLVNLLAMRHPDKIYPIMHPFKHDEFQNLAEYLLTNSKFDNSLILICWRHTKIIELAQALGVTEALTPWPDDDYDSVYVLEYKTTGKSTGRLSNFYILRNQYPVNESINWDTIYGKIQRL